MKHRSLPVALVAAAFFLVWLAPRITSPVFGQSAAQTPQAPHIGEGGLPQFEKDPAWPKVPARWKMGFGSAVAVDADDHIWIVSRPHTVPHSQAAMAAPPVMEFDRAGNFVQGWGGQSGPGYQWPSNEHGLFVDSKGFVWILGNADDKSNNPDGLPSDNQILKFTNDGKFVKAIGQSGQ